MTITMRTTKVVYLPDGTQRQFPVPFPVFDEGDVECLQVDGLTETLLTAFTVSDITAGSGYVTFSTPPAAGKSLVVRRRTARVQESDYPVAGRFPADIVERDFDRLTGMVQELDEQMDRAVLAPSDGSVDPGDLFDELTATVGKAQAYANAADASANMAEDMATNAENSAQAAANSADTAAQTVQTAAANAVNAATAQASAAEISAAAAAQSAEQAAAALPDNLVQRVTAAEAQNTQQDNRLDVVENGVAAISTTLIGSVQSLLCTDGYVPNGCVPANGGEYTRAQFPNLYDAYLAGGKLLTCTYAAWAIQVGLTGNCARFALDADNQKFKVPLFKDGDSITQAASAAELGKSYKAGLPNLTGDASRGAAEGDVGFFLTSGAPTGVFKKGRVVANILGGTTATAYALAFDASRANAIYGNSATVTDEQVRLRHFVVLASAQNSASVFDWSNYMAALAGKANVDLSNATGNAIGLYLYVRDEKASGTHGGTSAAAAWQTRDLNTVKNNSLSGASLANNRVTLPAGRYYVRGKAPAYAAANTRCAIYDATKAAYLLHGNSMTANQSYYGYVCPEVEGEFTLAAQTSIELRMYTGSAIGSYGLGFAASVANINEVFSELRIWKM